MNTVNLIGRLTRDPESRTTTTGKNVCSFSLAVQKRFKPQDGSPDADFFDCVAWDKQADFITNYITKGKRVAISGRLQSRKYTASDQSARTVVEIVVDEVQGLDRPRDETPPDAN
jgi:single-strand DNA-binding protein